MFHFHGRYACWHVWVAWQAYSHARAVPSPKDTGIGVPLPMPPSCTHSGDFRLHVVDHRIDGKRKLLDLRVLLKLVKSAYGIRFFSSTMPAGVIFPF